MDRRTTLKWIAAASALPLLRNVAWAEEQKKPLITAYDPVKGYGTDPDLIKGYKPGDVWPLTLTPEQRALATALSDLIIPADSRSPKASAVGVVDFIDEWISAPYPDNLADRKLILEGFAWLNAESSRRFGKQTFDLLSDAQQTAICDTIAYAARSPHKAAAKFFARYRDLTAGGFYTTPEGRKDVQYVGNVPSVTFEGPPLAVLKQVGLA